MFQCLLLNCLIIIIYMIVHHYRNIHVITVINFVRTVMTITIITINDYVFEAVICTGTLFLTDFALGIY